MLLILGMGGAVAWHFFKNKMPDQQTKGDTDLDDYDYGIDEDDDLDYNMETVLVPTALGNSLITVLPEQLQSPLLTAEWEQQLSGIQKGVCLPDDFLDGICAMLTELIQSYRPVAGADILFPSDEKVIGKCPRCGSKIVERSKGYFCTNRDCTFVLWRDSRFFTLKQKTLDRKTAAKLLEKGKAPLKGCVSPRTGQVYDATVLLEDDGIRPSFKLVFGNG